MADTFQLDIVTPERTVFSGRVEELVAPGILGEFAVLPGHATMLAELAVGGIRYRSGGSEQVVVGRGGYAEVTGEKVTVLLDQALFPDEINPEAMQKALEQETLHEYAPHDEQYIEWRKSIQWKTVCVELSGDSSRKGPHTK